ncbi:MAG TPA: helix-turn-helix transcriptional regulator [Sphingomonas sp.]|nr:helix-turn-helix transcriptional regulator [Sphingomonas sp.]
MDYAWFKQQKEALGLKDKEIAKAAGRERSVVNKIINGAGTFSQDRADELAELFQASRPEILYRLGLLEHGDVVREERTQRVTLEVVFPSAEALTGMFVGMLEAAGHPQIADELAPQLAQLLPGALARAQAAQAQAPSGGEKTFAGEGLQPLSTGRHALPPPRRM